MCIELKWPQIHLLSSSSFFSFFYFLFLFILIIIMYLFIFFDVQLAVYDNLNQIKN